MFDHLFRGKGFRLWQSLFLGIIVFTLIFGFRVAQQVDINTELNELNPQQQYSLQTSEAIAELSDNISRRVLLLIIGDDEDTVLDANDRLKTELDTLNGLKLHPDAQLLANELIQTLTPYRFSLLTDSQRQQIISSNNDAIVRVARTGLYSLTELRLLPFDQDPLSWHSDFIKQLFTTLQPDQPDNNQFHSVISFSIDAGANDMRSQEVLITELNNIVDDLRNEYDVSLERSGIFFFSIDAASKSKQDISLITTGSTIGVILLLLLVFRSLRSLVLPVSSILLGVTFAFVVSHTIYGNVHILTIVFGASLIGIVVDYSLHYFYHLSANQNDHLTLYRALSLSLLTSLIGYSSLGFSSLPALQKVAVFSCSGLLMAWLSVICIGRLNTHGNLKIDKIFLPAVQSLLSNFVQKINHKGWLIICLILLSSAFTVSKLSTAFDDDPRVFFKASEQLLTSERAVAAVANDYEPGRYLIIQGKTEEAIYNANQQLFSLLKSETAIDTSQLSSLFNWVPSKAKQSEDYQLQKRLYEKDGIASSLILQLGSNEKISEALAQEYLNAQNLFLTPKIIANILNQSTPPLLVAHDGLLTSFVLIKKGTNTQSILALSEMIEGVEFINTLQKTQDALQQQRYSASNLLAVAYLLIALLLLLRYRSFGSTAMLLVPLTASALVVLFCVGLGQTLNLFHIMALFLVLGFGMDYTIFIREVGDIRSITLQAILLSAITSLLSFGLLSISSIPVAYSFGITLLVGNCFNLLGVFVYSHCLHYRDKQ